MPQLVVILPETVDPHMVDQLAAAVQRMGGHIMPEEPDAGAAGPEAGMVPSPQGTVQAPMGAPAQGSRVNRPAGLA